MDFYHIDDEKRKPVDKAIQEMADLIAKDMIKWCAEEICIWPNFNDCSIYAYIEDVDGVAINSGKVDMADFIHDIMDSCESKDALLAWASCLEEGARRIRKAADES